MQLVRFRSLFMSCAAWLACDVGVHEGAETDCLGCASEDGAEIESDVSDAIDVDAEQSDASGDAVGDLILALDLPQTCSIVGEDSLPNGLVLRLCATVGTSKDFPSVWGRVDLFNSSSERVGWDACPWHRLTLEFLATDSAFSRSLICFEMLDECDRDPTPGLEPGQALSTGWRGLWVAQDPAIARNCIRGTVATEYSVAAEPILGVLRGSWRDTDDTTYGNVDLDVSIYPSPAGLVPNLP